MEACYILIIYSKMATGVIKTQTNIFNEVEGEKESLSIRDPQYSEHEDDKSILNFLSKLLLKTSIFKQN